MTILRAIIAAIGLVLVGAGCAVTFDAVGEPRPGVTVAPATVSVRDGDVINPYLGLVAYPGSRVTEREVDGRDSETTFVTTASLGTVYRFFHDQLVADGWVRVELDVDSDEIEATYVRGGLELELELEDEGRGRFELEIDVD